jgi:hypothetical protein
MSQFCDDDDEQEEEEEKEEEMVRWEEIREWVYQDFELLCAHCSLCVTELE